jgi:hypothetical protein
MARARSLIGRDRRHATHPAPQAGSNKSEKIKKKPTQLSTTLTQSQHPRGEAERITPHSTTSNFES